MRRTATHGTVVRTARPPCTFLRRPAKLNATVALHTAMRNGTATTRRHTNDCTSNLALHGHDSENGLTLAPPTRTEQP